MSGDLLPKPKRSGEIKKLLKDDSTTLPKLLKPPSRPQVLVSKPELKTKLATTLTKTEKSSDTQNQAHIEFLETVELHTSKIIECINNLFNNPGNKPVKRMEYYAFQFIKNFKSKPEFFSSRELFSLYCRSYNLFVDEMFFRLSGKQILDQEVYDLMVAIEFKLRRFSTKVGISKNIETGSQILSPWLALEGILPAYLTDPINILEIFQNPERLNYLIINIYNEEKLRNRLLNNIYYSSAVLEIPSLTALDTYPNQLDCLVVSSHNQTLLAVYLYIYTIIHQKTSKAVNDLVLTGEIESFLKCNKFSIEDSFNQAISELSQITLNSEHVKLNQVINQSNFSHYLTSSTPFVACQDFNIERSKLNAILSLNFLEFMSACASAIEIEALQIKSSTTSKTNFQGKNRFIPVLAIQEVIQEGTEAINNLFRIRS